jgi:hypothetical protein
MASRDASPPSSRSPRTEAPRAGAAADESWGIYAFALDARSSCRRMNVTALTAFSSCLKRNDYCWQEFEDGASVKSEDARVMLVADLAGQLFSDVSSPAHI